MRCANCGKTEGFDGAFHVLYCQQCLNELSNEPLKQYLPISLKLKQPDDFTIPVSRNKLNKNNWCYHFQQIEDRRC